MRGDATIWYGDQLVDRLAEPHTEHKPTRMLDDTSNLVGGVRLDDITQRDVAEKERNTADREARVTESSGPELLAAPLLG